MNFKSHKSTHFWTLAIKIGLFLGLGVWGYRLLLGNITVQYEQIQGLWLGSQYIYRDIAILLLFTIVNWTLESYKWQKLIAFQSTIKTAIRFRESIKQVLTAHAAGLITPAKLGAYGVKPLFYKAVLHKRIALLHLLGNLAQMSVTCCLGILGLYLLSAAHFPTYLTPLTYCLAGGIFMYMLGRTWISGLRRPSILQKGLDTIGLFSKAQVAQILGIAFLRYTVFAHQYYVLLLFFDVPLSYTEAMGLIMVYYLISSLLPIAQLLDVVIKGSVAVLLFSLANVPELTIICITAIMWFFNVVLPLLPASYFIVRLKPKAIPTFRLQRP